MPQSLGDMLRAFSRIVTHNGAMWWFDMWGGWYDDEQLMVLQKWAKEFYETTALADGLAPRAQLAVFVDEKTLYLRPWPMPSAQIRSSLWDRWALPMTASS